MGWFDFLVFCRTWVRWRELIDLVFLQITEAIWIYQKFCNNRSKCATNHTSSTRRRASLSHSWPDASFHLKDAPYERNLVHSIPEKLCAPHIQPVTLSVPLLGHYQGVSFFFWRSRVGKSAGTICIRRWWNQSKVFQSVEEWFRFYTSDSFQSDRHRY